MYFNEVKDAAKNFGYWELKLLPGIRVIADGLAERPRPEPPTSLELHLYHNLHYSKQRHQYFSFFPIIILIIVVSE